MHDCDKILKIPHNGQTPRKIRQIVVGMSEDLKAHELESHAVGLDSDMQDSDFKDLDRTLQIAQLKIQFQFTLNQQC